MPSDSTATTSHYGPACPKGLLRQIYEHHTDCGSGWFHAWDAETGDGTLSQELSKHFQSIVSTSPNPDNITHAQQTLSADTTSAKINHRIHDPTTPLPSYRPTSLDLIVLSISLTNSTPFSSASSFQEFLTTAADLLKSHGTLAIWAVGTRLLFLPPDAGVDMDVEKVQKTWDKALGKWMDARHTAITAVDELLTSALDTLTLDPQTWENEKRIYFNRAEPMMPSSSSSSTTTTLPTTTTSSSSSNTATATTISIPSKTTLQYPSADVEWLNSYLQSLDPDVDVEKVCKKEMEEVGKLLGGKGVAVGWPGVLVLGSKK